jgi:hypothetical protein
VVDRGVRLDRVVDGVLVGLTMPAVTVRARPNGLPMATTSSPTWARSELPRVSGVSARAGALTRRTARSVVGSEPTIVALKLSLFEKLTWTDPAPATTW